MNTLELQIPDINERTLRLSDIDEESANNFINDLTKIDMQDLEITRSNLAKIAALGIDADQMLLPPIRVMMNSPGGYIYEALAIYDMIDGRDDMMCFCSGKVMSAATFILLAFPPDKRIATKNTTFMIHQPSSFSFGKLKDMEDNVKEVRRLHKIITHIYLKKSKLTKDILDKNFREKDDWFFTAKDALKYGLISKII